jgi:polysaccharide export outer membrane protein
MKRFTLLIMMILLSFGMLWSLPAAASGESYVIGPEDMLQITVWGSPDLSVLIPVRPDGMISVPLVGDIKADGMTPAQLKEYLEKEYLKYIKAPTVSVVVTAVNSFKVYVVGGGVSAGGSSSGAISLKRNTTLLQLLAELGSLQGADLKSAYILRAGKKLQVDFMKLINNGDVSQDVDLRRDDVIFIPPDLENRIKVVGAVKNPGIFPYMKGMTALDAVLSAGGFTEFASQNNVEIVRQEGGQVKNIQVRLKDVIKNGDLKKNVPLNPGDMVSVKTGIF